MVSAVPIFYASIEHYISVVVWLFCLVLGAASFLHCVVQRADAFPAIGTMSKGVWLAMIGGGLLLTALSPGIGLGYLGIFPLIAAGIFAVYLLDIRPTLRDAVDGHGSW
ncbi:hypothetical protein GCM10010399_70490 [Dactylosporangium fulvum]|uniref:DUF2516 family protein n=1 Tax=Dactylosporangium fulvum TaxID=53359 RepID=A0ABY5W2X7_9ACTN|nr:DUF2516 family protein [Dactylosporangium fulvum]UWP83461.1 DUF2516 family protein [Dactylosporangium fulvum]